MDAEIRVEIEAIKAELVELKLSRIQKTIRALKKKEKMARFIFLLLISGLPLLSAISVPNVFVAGTPTVAADVNANFTAISNFLTAMENKSWRLIFEYDSIVNSASVVANSLDGNIDTEYMFLARMINASGGSCTYKLNPNNDTSNNYNLQASSATGVGTVGANQINYDGIHFGLSNAAAVYSYVTGTMFSKTGHPRMAIMSEMNSVSASNVGYLETVGTVWGNSAANITSFVFNSTANCIGVGSHIEIWARR